MISSRALVLSGGNMKGAFQVGALPVVLKDFRPDAIYGISVGSLNGAFLADRAGREILSGKTKEEIDWVAIAEELEELWLTKLTKSSDIFKNKLIRLLWEIISKRFDGFVDSKPLKELIADSFNTDNLVNSPVDLHIGAVNMEDGCLFYARKDDPDILEYIYASAAIPGLFPPVNNKTDHTYIDGAMRASAPIGQAIADAVDDIVAILCHAEQLNANESNLKNAKNFFERVMDIFSNEQITNDILIANLRKKIMELEQVSGIPISNSERSALIGEQHENLKMRIIRPTDQPVIKMDNFSVEDVKRLIALGRKKAMEICARPKGALVAGLYY